MAAPADHGDPSFGYQGLASPTSAGKFDAPGPGNHEHDPAFGHDFFHSDFFDAVEPSTLQVAHTSHDDSCVDACPGVYNAQGLPRGSYPAATFARPRLATSSCSYPYALESPVFPSSSSQTYDAAYSFLASDLDVKYPLNLGGRYIHHTLNNNQQFSTPPINNAAFCNVPRCPVQDDCVSTSCSQPACSDQCCSTACEDESCEQLGTACHDLECLSGDMSEAAFDYSTYFHHDWNFGSHAGHALVPHDQPCNHTSTEHDAAFTLQDLKAVPGSATQHQQHAFINAFNCPIYNAEADAVPSTMETPALTADTNVPSPMSTRPSIAVAGSQEVSDLHTCRWQVKGQGICGQTFNSNEELHDHLGKDHVGQMSSKTKYLCLWEGCSRKDDQIFASRNKLRRHISTHTSFKPFKCEHCQERFSAQQALDQHIRTHTGEKPYKCDVAGCEKAFKQKSALTMHKRTHTGEKPLKCDICGKCFCESSNLSKHRKIHAAEYKYSCKICQRSFIRVDQLRRHMTKHDRDKSKGKSLLASDTLAQLEDTVDVLPVVDENFVVA
ncbi:hypothetical protein JX266_008216 [Neoarthrinium moseri]|nr:hypothetical protein JX266_008216 [Neoarthrinium moseri]